MFQEAAQGGLGDLDPAAIVLPLEERAGFTIRRPSKEVRAPEKVWTK
jgi:hypothetical protein